MSGPSLTPDDDSGNAVHLPPHRAHSVSSIGKSDRPRTQTQGPAAHEEDVHTT